MYGFLLELNTGEEVTVQGGRRKKARAGAPGDTALG